MKKCLSCNQTFSDENSFCLNDGTTLQYVSETNQTPTVFQTSAEMPTQLISRPQANLSNSSSRIPSWLYALIGAMAAIIVALGFAFFVTRSPAEKEAAKTESTSKSNEIISNTNQFNIESKSQNSERQNVASLQNKTLSKQMETPPINAEVVRDLLNRWERAQDAQNYADYRNCYGQPFQGVKRAKSETKTYNYTTWLNDRRKILSNAIGLDIEIKNLQISIEGNTATVEFDQYYRSLKFSDWGPKVLKIKMFIDGAKIVYEELKTSHPSELK